MLLFICYKLIIKYFQIHTTNMNQSVMFIIILVNITYYSRGLGENLMAINFKVESKNKTVANVVASAKSFIAHESYPNGNGGPNDGQVRFLQDILKEFGAINMVTTRGDAYTVGSRVSVLPKKLSYSELKRLTSAMNKFKVIASLGYDWRHASQYRNWMLGGDAPSVQHQSLFEAYVSGATPEANIKQMDNFHLGEVYSTACVPVIKWGEFEGRVSDLRISVFNELLGDGVFLSQDSLRTPTRKYQFEELPCVMQDGSVREPGDYLYRRTVKLDGTVL